MKFGAVIHYRGNGTMSLELRMREISKSGEQIQVTLLAIASTSECDAYSRCRHQPFTLLDIKQSFIKNFHEFRGPEKNPFRKESIYYRFYVELQIKSNNSDGTLLA